MFTDRADAGQRLGRRLGFLRGAEAVVLGLPRGGVPVAFEVARELGAPLDVIVVRKLGVPSQPELAMGAIGEDGIQVISDEVTRSAQITAAELTAVAEHERAELDRRASSFRAGRSRIDVAGRTVVLVDDGLATGATARAACQVARLHGAVRVVLAVPVGPRQSVEAMRGCCDEVVCLESPRLFFAVGQWYDNFRQVSDAEVVDLLDRRPTALPHRDRAP
jgi:putative phosphoribosyl transferase